MTPKFSIVVLERDFGDTVKFPKVHLEPTYYSWHNLGGPEEANITAYGSEEELWDLCEWLRAPVEIWDDRPQPVWWGYIEQVTVNVGGVSVGVSLDSMSNRVAGLFINPGADERSVTAWAADGPSSSAYGYKELLLSTGAGACPEAIEMRDKELAIRKYPTPTVDHNPEAQALSATINCRGWWDTLTWQYYGNAAGQEAYIWEGLGTQAFQYDNNNREVRQSFSLPATGDNWWANQVVLKLRKANNPTTRVWIDITGSTGTILSSGSILAADIKPNHAWHSAVMSPCILLTAGWLYYIIARSSSTMSATNYYVIQVNEELSYTRGDFTIWNGTNWVARSPDADMLFKVQGALETSNQIYLAASRGGQFFSDISVTSSSIWDTAYQSGDRVAKDVIHDLLNIGVKNGNKLRATVDINRKLWVTEEESETTTACPLELSQDGQVRRLEWPITTECPAGQWCTLTNIIPANLNTATLTKMNRFFIERASYVVQSGRIRLEPRASAIYLATVKGG